MMERDFSSIRLESWNEIIGVLDDFSFSPDYLELVLLCSKRLFIRMPRQEIGHLPFFSEDKGKIISIIRSDRGYHFNKINHAPKSFALRNIESVCNHVMEPSAVDDVKPENGE